MDRQVLAATAFAAVLVLAGCAGIGTGGTTTAPLTDDPSTTTPTEPTSVEYEATVFDGTTADQPVIEGGLTPAIGEGPDASYYATLVSDGTDRFNWNQLPDTQAQFVNETDFEDASILVVQAFPKSSVPDYRVESVTRSGDALSVRINDSSAMGTDDITLETVLIRVQHDGTPPTSATVTTQNGAAFETGEGPVTITPQDDDDDSAYDVTLPLSSDNESRNVEDPRGIEITNDGTATNGYNLTVFATVSPDCLDAEPPCGMPDKEVAIVHETGKLRPGESVTFGDLIARHGDYEVVVEAEVPDGDGRQTVTDSFEWRVSEYYFDGFVTIDDDGVDITQAVQ